MIGKTREEMVYELAVLGTAIIAGGVASVAGFGIGSLLTPLLSLTLGTKLAVAAVSIPHLLGTAIRFFLLRQHLDRRVLWSFGITSATGGLIGALLHTAFATPALTLLFGLILLFAGFMGASGLSEKLRFGGLGAWIAGGVSGALGGLVGNQGGIRSAALLGFPLPKESFVATATAIGLLVDGARMPVYFWADREGLLASVHCILLATAGVVAGTLLGAKLLVRLDQGVFRRVVSGLIFLLGVFMVWRGCNYFPAP